MKLEARISALEAAAPVEHELSWAERDVIGRQMVMEAMEMARSLPEPSLEEYAETCRRLFGETFRLSPSDLALP